MNSKIYILLCCLLINCSVVVEAQSSSHKAALLAVEYESTNGIGDKQHLVRFHFNNGELVSKEVIFTSQTDDVRFDIGKNHIYQNKYVISNWGDIIDIDSKTLLHKGKGEYVGAEGNLIVQKVERVDVEGYFYYDLVRKRYGHLPRTSKWALPGLLSPNQTKSIEGDGSNIFLHHLSHKPKLLGSRFSVQVSENASFIAKPPLFWLDNYRILTQKRNGEIIVLQIDGTLTPLVNIPIEVPSFIVYSAKFF